MDCTLIISANGPKNRMAIGKALVDAIWIIEKTRPNTFGSVISCTYTVCAVVSIGIKNPEIKISMRYVTKFVAILINPNVTPKATKQTAMANALFLICFLNAIKTPPTREPIVQIISFAVNRHTSFPNVRSTINGDNAIAGVNKIKATA